MFPVLFGISDVNKPPSIHTHTIENGNHKENGSFSINNRFALGAEGISYCYWR